MGCVEHQVGKEKLNSCSASGMLGAVNDGPLTSDTANANELSRRAATAQVDEYL